MTDSRWRAALAAYGLPLLLALYALLAALYAARTPTWQAPDEPAHYNYVRQVAVGGCCPVITPGDWDSAYLETLKSARFAPELLNNIPGIQYEDHQPPLFYVLAAPVYTFLGADLWALRLFSAAWGLVTIACAYQMGRLLFPERPWAALAAAALVGFVPQHIAILASFNNDSLAGALIALTLLTALHHVRGARWAEPWLLGALVGFGLLTKLSTIFLVGLGPLALAARVWAAPDGARAPLVQFLRALVGFALPALLIAGAWPLRNVAVYGFPDLFGLAAHDAVVADQLRTQTLIAEIGPAAYAQRALTTTFNSFWGQLGWMAAPLPDWAYVGIAALLALALVGGVWAFVRRRASIHAPERWRTAAWALLGVAFAVACLQYVYYNTEFVQFQGRYLYPGLAPFALFIAWGLDGVRAALPRARWAWALTLAPWLLAALNLWVIWRVLPGLAP